MNGWNLPKPARVCGRTEESMVHIHGASGSQCGLSLCSVKASGPKGSQGPRTATIRQVAGWRNQSYSK